MPTHIDKTEMSVPKILKKEKVLVLQKASSKWHFESLDGTIRSLIYLCKFHRLHIFQMAKLCYCSRSQFLHILNLFQFMFLHLPISALVLGTYSKLDWIYIHVLIEDMYSFTPIYVPILNSNKADTIGWKRIFAPISSHLTLKRLKNEWETIKTS